jgi:hypothetical protein
VQVDPIKPALKAPESKHLKPKYYELPSNLAFKFNLRRFKTGVEFGVANYHMPCMFRNPKVRRCRLTVSKPVLKAKAPMVSALEGTI